VLLLAGLALTIEPAVAIDSVQFHIEENGVPGGPYGLAELRDRVASGSLTASTLVWSSGMSDWQPAGQVSTLAGLFAPVAPPGLPSAQPVQPSSMPSSIPDAPGHQPSSRLTGDVGAFLEGDWRNTGPLPVDGYGPTEADMTMSYRADGSLSVRGQYRVNDPSSGTIPIDVRGSGRWHNTIEERDNNTGRLNAVRLDSEIELTMTLPPHFGIPDQRESLTESDRIQIIDENSVRDANGMVWQRLQR
jgi:hypothetical protein